MKRGFTIIEILVVVGVIMILFSLGISSFSKTAQKQFILFKEQMKIITALQKAKSLSLAVYGESSPPCGYGIYFKEPRRVVLFRELPPTGFDCVSVDFGYSGDNSGERFEEIVLDGDVEFTPQLELNNIVFFPPEPFIIIDGLPNKNEALIKLRTIDGFSERMIKVTTGGQITTQ